MIETPSTATTCGLGYKTTWLREQIAGLLGTFYYVKSPANTADIFTMTTTEHQFSGLRISLLGLLDEFD